MNILVSTSKFCMSNDAPLKKLKDMGYQVSLNPYKRKLTKDESIELLQGIDGLIAGVETLDREVFEKTSLSAVSRCGSGMSNVDLDAAKDLGISVVNTPDATTNTVAEMTLAGMLNCLRNISAMHLSMRQGKWNKILGKDLYGKTVVIVGYGRIGRRLHKLLKPFDVDVIVCDPAHVNLDIRDIIPHVDIVSVHVNTNETIFTKEVLDKADGIIFCNASRGSVVDENALIEAINKGNVKGAWIDVFDEEPYNGPLCSMDQVIVTPHASSYSEECRCRMEMEAVNNLIELLHV